MMIGVHNLTLEHFFPPYFNLTYESALINGFMKISVESLKYEVI